MRKAQSGLTLGFSNASVSLRRWSREIQHRKSDPRKLRCSRKSTAEDRMQLDGGKSLGDAEKSVERLSLESVVAVARHGAKVRLGKEARGRILASRRHVEEIIGEERPVYGATTGFGALATTHIS